jgi:hypothetical protein
MHARGAIGLVRERVARGGVAHTHTQVAFSAAARRGLHTSGAFDELLSVFKPDMHGVLLQG